MSKKLTTENFVESACIIHGDKYNYSNVEYINNKTKVCIICPEHGEFWQIPKEHLKGCGCPECGLKRRATLRSKGAEKFIKEACAIHGDRYGYSKVEYKNANTPVTIICPIHGEFSIRPSNHLKGQGCRKCANLLSGSYQKSNTEDFINKSIKIHGDKYDYSNVNYINNRVKINIICPIHGEFIQKPLDHLHGCGCPKCGLKLSVSEIKVFNILKDVYKNVVHQYKPKWLHNKTSPQSLDIFLSDYNIGVEYQGGQHFYPKKIFGGEDEFILIKERDKRKFKKCTENGVKLFYVSFERKIPEDYFQPIYKTPEDLITAINEYIKENQLTI